MKKLSELRIGRSAVIKAYDKGENSIKLMEMGCIPGEVIRVDQIAPLGDPIAVHIAGYNLSLRLNEAELIIIEEID